MHCIIFSLRWHMFLSSVPLWIIYPCLLAGKYPVKTLHSFLLPAHSFPPQRQYNKNLCTFSISCTLWYLYGKFTVFATATMVQNFTSATVIRLCKTNRHCSSFALRLFATYLSVINKKYSWVHYRKDWKLLLYNTLSEKERKSKVCIQKNPAFSVIRCHLICLNEWNYKYLFH